MEKAITELSNGQKTLFTFIGEKVEPAKTSPLLSGLEMEVPHLLTILLLTNQDSARQIKLEKRKEENSKKT